MRGIAYDRFGGPEALAVRDDLPEPPVGPDTVLVRSHAAGVNPVDIGIREGRLAGFFPYRFPIVPGWDVAGTVEAVGPAVPITCAPSATAIWTAKKPTPPDARCTSTRSPSPTSSASVSAW